MAARLRRAALAASVLLTPFAWSGTASGDVSPPSASFVVEAGASVTETKTVTVPRVPAKADIVIAIDTTGSMAPQIGQAKAQATDLVGAVKTEIPDAHFAVVDFRDSGDVHEYLVRTPNTADAAAVQAGIDAMSAGGGGDFPEAQNLVLSRAADDAETDLWRAGTRKFVVLITDAPPHAADLNGFPACTPNTPDPHGLETDEVVAALEAAQRTLFAVTTDAVADCYSSIAAASFTGSARQPLGADLSTQIVDLIEEASAVVDDVHMEVAGANPNAGWITFDPPSAGPVGTPATLHFEVTIAVPAGTASGDYLFDLVALADGGDIGHQALTITVNAAPVCTAATAEPARLWPPNGRMVPVGVTGVTDADGDTVAVHALTVTQDEPVDALADGSRGPDGRIDAGTAAVRAERAGSGDGRVYAIGFSASDGRGGECTGTATVSVPRDQRGAPAVDSGQSYDSLVG